MLVSSPLKRVANNYNTRSVQGDVLDLMDSKKVLNIFDDIVHMRRRGVMSYQFLQPGFSGYVHMCSLD